MVCAAPFPELYDTVGVSLIYLAKGAKQRRTNVTRTEQTRESSPGPILSIGWFEDVLDKRMFTQGCSLVLPAANRSRQLHLFVYFDNCVLELWSIGIAWRPR